LSAPKNFYSKRVFSDTQTFQHIVGFSCLVRQGTITQQYPFVPLSFLFKERDNKVFMAAFAASPAWFPPLAEWRGENADSKIPLGILTIGA